MLVGCDTTSYHQSYGYGIDSINNEYFGLLVRQLLGGESQEKIQDPRNSSSSFPTSPSIHPMKLYILTRIDARPGNAQEATTTSAIIPLSYRPLDIVQIPKRTKVTF